MERAKAGGEAGPLVDSPRWDDLDAFYRREYAGAVRLAYALTGNRWAAEDIAHDAFEAAQRAWSETYVEHRRAWIHRVVVDLCTSRIRRRVAEGRALLRLAARTANVVPPLEPPDAELWAAVRSLPRRQAEAIVLHYVCDSPASEIAEVMGCATSTVLVHLHRGRTALARTLQGGER